MYEVRFAPTSNRADWREGWNLLGVDLTAATMRLTVESPGDVKLDISYPADPEWIAPAPSTGEVDWNFSASVMNDLAPGETYTVNWRLTRAGVTEHLIKGTLPIFDGGPE